MNIGMIGSGNMGSAIGRLWARQGHQVMFSYSRDLKKLDAIAKSAGANARTGTPAEAARFGEVIMLTVQYAVLEDALNAAGSLDGKSAHHLRQRSTTGFSGADIRIANRTHVFSS